MRVGAHWLAKVLGCRWRLPCRLGTGPSATGLTLTPTLSHRGRGSRPFRVGAGRPLPWQSLIEGEGVAPSAWAEDRPFS